MIQIVTDSSCDLSLARIKELGVHLIPQTIHFGDKTFIDGENINTEQFFQLLESEPEVPKTAQPSPYIFEEHFKEILDRGDDILCIFVGDQLSGTSSSAKMAKNALTDYDANRIQFVDSGAVCIAVGLLVEITNNKIKEGLTDVVKLQSEMQEVARKTKIYGALNTLTYMKKGGRLSGPAALVGTMLNFCPIICNDNGLVINIAKVKGKKKLYSKMAELVINDGVDTNYPIAFADAISDGSLDTFKDLLKSEVDISNQVKGLVGPVVGTFSGPGIVAVAFVMK